MSRGQARFATSSMTQRQDNSATSGPTQLSGGDCRRRSPSGAGVVCRALPRASCLADSAWSTSSIFSARALPLIADHSYTGSRRFFTSAHATVQEGERLGPSNDARADLRRGSGLPARTRQSRRRSRPVGPGLGVTWLVAPASVRGTLTVQGRCWACGTSDLRRTRLT